jgi:ectoine hydroxylase-related dioxygenase (phytanoyl-CoA dioxygenase family)
MEPLLRDPALRQQFGRDGFVTVRLLSPEQVQTLLALYRETVRASDVTGLYESSRKNPYRVNRFIHDAIREQVSIAGKEIFLPSRIYGGTFMVKSHLDSDMLPLHQDWSIVEEEQYSTLFVWCPLVDVSVRNGAIFALPGSHRWFHTLRSGTYPSNRYILPEQLHRQAKDVPLKAGEAILYSDSLFHGSHANNGDADRIVVTAQVIEETAPLVYFQKCSESEVDVYEGSPEFYLTHIDALAGGSMPDGVPRLYRRPYTHVAVTNETLEEKIREHFTEREDGRHMKLFRDPDKQSAFERDGFVVLDLIGPAQVEELLAFYASLQNAPRPQSGFQVSLDDQSPKFVQTVTEKLIATAGPSVDRHFEEHQIFTASFVTKAKNPRGFVPPHQDWTFVDESLFWSATVWCPLVDVNDDNGALCLLRGSHRLYDHVRPSPSPQYAPPFADQLFGIFPYMKVVELRAGQAVVFNNQTLHASPPNTQQQTRIAFGMGVTHGAAQLRHYYLLPGNVDLMEGYEVSREFFHTYNNARLTALHEKGERPTGLNSIGTFAMRYRRYETSELEEKIRSAGNTKDVSLLARVAELVGDYAAPAPVGAAAAVVGDTRPLWRVYTPRNIYREIRHRLKSFAS